MKYCFAIQQNQHQHGVYFLLAVHYNAVSAVINVNWLVLSRKSIAMKARFPKWTGMSSTVEWRGRLLERMAVADQAGTHGGESWKTLTASSTFGVDFVPVAASGNYGSFSPG
jgi:hypothetical protein